MNNSYNIVNKYKLIYIPILIAIIALFTVSISSYFISRYLLLTQMKQDGINLAMQIAEQIGGNNDSLSLANDMLEERIRVANKVVIANQDKLSNELMREIQRTTMVDEINWFSAEGVLIYSSLDRKGGIISSDDPLYSFILGSDIELMENVRTRAITGQNFKYGSMKNHDGAFVQAGISVEQIQNLTRQFSYQTLVTSIIEKENILNAFIIDNNLRVVADARLHDIGIVYNPKSEPNMVDALMGKVSAFETYNDEISGRILNVMAPIIIDDEIHSAIVLGLSTKNAYSYIYMISVASFIVVLTMMLIFLWVQRINIIKPVRQLDTGIKEIDVESHIEYRLNLKEGNTFFGLSLSINKILDKVHNYFDQLVEKELVLKKSNEEISAAYEQLMASEEELKAQFDEIIHQKKYIDFLAYHDPLTSLPNRRKFIEELKGAIKNNQYGAVMLLDLDNFKGINDTLGHVYGDKVLIKIAEGLKTIEDDKVFISRFGGDEFLVLIRDESSFAEIRRYAEKLVEVFKSMITFDSNKIHISFSMGITLFPLDSNDVNQLIMNADMALYKVKNTGKNGFEFFEKEMLDSIAEKARIEEILRETIKNNSLSLVYQPQIDTFSGEVVCFEALLRINQYDISPELLVAVAEEVGLIIDIGRQVTTKAIAQLSRWKNKGLSLKPISINFSAKQLNDTGFVDFIEGELSNYDIDAKYIEIEITESIFLDNTDETLVFIEQLKSMGITISIDDFGTGYSSLSYLTFIPADKIKIDKHLNDKFLEIENIKVMDSLISLAHSLKLKVVAEGIETFDQYRRLKVGKCDYIQGYFFSKPLHIDDVEKIFNNNFLDDLYN